jgi:hypothetical protein
MSVTLLNLRYQIEGCLRVLKEDVGDGMGMGS